MDSEALGFMLIGAWGIACVGLAVMLRRVERRPPE
jgi:hypothetical protein